MTAEATVDVNGEALVLLGAGALYWPARAALIVSDLHFEKGSHFAVRGVFLPPYDTRTTLRRLGALIRTHQPKLVISLGDAFHDLGAEARMDDEDAALLEQLGTAARWVWILGNHDPAPPARFGGAVEETLMLGRLVFRHEPMRGEAPGEIAGHLHPAARVRAESRLVRRRCFATDGLRLVTPAFGAYAGGLNVLDDAFTSLFSSVTAYILGAHGVYPFSGEALVADARAERRQAG